MGKLGLLLSSFWNMMGFLFFSFVKILKALDKDHFNKVEKKLDHVFF